jgi:CheY-like chemotaxis protein
VSMRILFADDSMTAQNMGKKILTDAGYEVVAVSNGAAAVKKIAEHKPDIIILDIYMPGYTGLEVCDKVRGSADTLRTPVLLTVGKMEPYRAEDANRVKADGVIIKPFEASDLLAVIKKLEERVVPKSVAVTEQTIVLERPPEFTEFPQAAEEDHREAAVETNENTVQATVDVPDNMATAAAFSDLLGSDTAHPFPSMPISSGVDHAELPVVPDSSSESSSSRTAPAEETGVADDDSSASEFISFSAQHTLADDTPAQDTPAQDPLLDTSEGMAAAEDEPQAAVSFAAADFTVDMGAPGSTLEPSGSPSMEEPHPIPASIDDFASAEPAELNIETEAGPVPVVTVPFMHEPELETESASSSSLTTEHEPTATSPEEKIREEEVRVQSSTETRPSAVFAAATLPAPEAASPSFIDPGLETQGVNFDSFSAKVEAQIQHIETIVSASEARHAEVEIESPVHAGLPSPEAATEAMPAQAEEDDFEARVAAAMSAYEQPLAAEDSAGLHVVNDAGAGFTTEAASAGHDAPEPAAEPVALEAPYSFEYSPPITAPEPEPALSTAKPEPVEEVPHFPGAEIPLHTEARDEEAPTSSEVARESQVSSHAESPQAGPAPTATEPERASLEDEKIMSEIAAQLPAPPGAAKTEPGGETQIIASAVHRVLERLKPHLIEEISRELKSNKRPEEK